jgi:uncharacterized protein
LEIRPQDPAGRLVIQRYGGGGFVIGGEAIRGSVLVFPARALPWPVVSADRIAIETLGPIAEDGAVDLLLVGCGPRAAAIDGAVRDHLRRAGTILEAMDTGAACRTYNVLVGEGRRVAAALIALA